MQPLHTRKIGGSNPSTATIYLAALALSALALIVTGEVLECVMLVNAYETWCD